MQLRSVLAECSRGYGNTSDTKSTFAGEYLTKISWEVQGTPSESTRIVLKTKTRGNYNLVGPLYDGDKGTLDLSHEPIYIGGRCDLVLEDWSGNQLRLRAALRVSSRPDFR